MTAQTPREGDAARRALGFFASLATLAILGGVFGQRLLGAAAGPDAEIITALKATEDDALSLPLGSGPAPLVSKEHFFARIIVDVKPGANEALATSTLDFVGEVGKTKVSSLGVEKTPFEKKRGDWSPTKGAAPRLTAIVSALEARRRALESGDVAALARLGRLSVAQVEEDPELQRILALRARSFRAERWLIRSERDEVVVTEESRLVAETPDRPVDEKHTRRLLLTEDGGEFSFAAGLM